MSQAGVENALQDLLQALTRFADDQVTRGDYRVLDQGNQECAVITPGGWAAQEELATLAMVQHWTANIDIFEREQDADSWADFVTMLDDIVATLGKYPNLGQSAMEIRDVTLSLPNDPIKVRSDAGGTYIAATLRVEVEQVINLTGGDYA